MGVNGQLQRGLGAARGVGHQLLHQVVRHQQGQRGGRPRSPPRRPAGVPWRRRGDRRQAGAAVVGCRQAQDAAAGSWGSPALPPPAPCVARSGGGRSPAGPSSRIAGELGGQPGRFLGSSVGDHRDRRIRHGIIPLTARNSCSCIGTEVQEGKWLRSGPCPPAKPANQRTQPVGSSLPAASRGLPGRAIGLHPKEPWTRLRNQDAIVAGDPLPNWES